LSEAHFRTLSCYPPLRQHSESYATPVGPRRRRPCSPFAPPQDKTRPSRRARRSTSTLPFPRHQSLDGAPPQGCAPSSLGWRARRSLFVCGVPAIVKADAAQGGNLLDFQEGEWHFLDQSPPALLLLSCFCVADPDFFARLVVFGSNANPAAFTRHVLTLAWSGARPSSHLAAVPFSFFFFFFFF
jgi:hypothetical protein